MFSVSASLPAFWGKFVSPTRYLPLAAHCLDVGMVFRALCDLDGIARSLAHASDVPLSPGVLDRLAVVAMLHDVGKANLGFQLKVFDERAPKAGHIRELAPILDNEVGIPGLASRFLEALPPGFLEWFQSEEDAYSYMLAAISHHGRPITFQGERPAWFWLAANHWWQPREGYDPMGAISEIIRWAKEAFRVAFDDTAGPLPSRPEFQHRFAGLLMLADWIGSHSAWFPIRPDSLDERLKQNRWVVPRVIRALGLDAPAE